MDHQASKDALRRAAKLIGSQAELARRLGLTKSRITQMLDATDFPVPIQHAITIERETLGAVTVEELRPDVDWAVIRAPRRRRSTDRHPLRRSTDQVLSAADVRREIDPEAGA